MINNNTEINFEQYDRCEGSFEKFSILTEIMKTMNFDEFYNECMKRGLYDDLIEIGSHNMTKEQVLRCYICSQDSTYYRLKKFARENEFLKNKLTKIENFPVYR